MASQSDKTELMKQCRKYFKTIDTNRDGKLNPTEFSALCEEIGCSSDREALRRSYKKADKNEDGVVTLNEFMEAFVPNKPNRPRGPNGPSAAEGRKGPVRLHKQNTATSQKGVTREDEECQRDQMVQQIRRYFQEIDSDGSGTLDPNEFSEMLGKMGAHVEKSELMKVYRKADTNGDGEVSFREFMTAFVKDRRGKDSKRSRILPFKSTTRLTQIKEEDVRSGFAYFWKSDRNFDGRLDLNEYTEMVGLLGMKLSKREIAKAFKVADRSCRGYVSFMDFVTTYINEILPGAMTLEKLQEIYQSNDEGHKGYLTSKEFHQCMKKLGSAAEDENLDKLMISASKNCAGKLNFKDFCTILGLDLTEGTEKVQGPEGTKTAGQPEKGTCKYSRTLLKKSR